MTENKQILLIVTLETKVKRLEAELSLAKAEIKSFQAKTNTVGQIVARRPTKEKKHARIRKDGSHWGNWGTVMSVVRKAEGMTARELSEITGFDRYAIYSAARRAGVKLKPAGQARG